MDVTVTHLNNRLALQIPQELPMGLVFVIGTVSFAEAAVSTELVAHGRYRHIYFDLVDNKHRIRCVLVVRAIVDYELELGSRVRVGGHLRFDPLRAEYYLLARDLERLDEDILGDSSEVSVDQEEIAALLIDIRRRTTHQVPIPDAGLPQWVQDIAPPVFQSENEKQDQFDEPFSESELSLIEAEKELTSSIADLLDQSEEVELTPDLISELEEKTAKLESSSVQAAAKGEPLSKNAPIPIARESPIGNLSRQEIFLLLILIFLLMVLLVLGVLLFV